MLPDRVSNPGPLTYESGALPIALRGPAPRVAQRYGTIAAHSAPCVRSRCVCSVLRAHVQFCRFDKVDATANTAHCDTAITDRHSDTTIFQLRAHWVRIS